MSGMGSQRERARARAPEREREREGEGVPYARGAATERERESTLGVMGSSVRVLAEQLLVRLLLLSSSADPTTCGYRSS